MKQKLLPLALLLPVFINAAQQDAIDHSKLPASLETSEKFLSAYRHAYTEGERAVKSGDPEKVKEANQAWEKIREGLVVAWDREKMQKEREKQKASQLFCAGARKQSVTKSSSVDRQAVDQRATEEAQKKLPFSPSNVRFGTLPPADRKEFERRRLKSE